MLINYRIEHLQIWLSIWTGCYQPWAFISCVSGVGEKVIDAWSGHGAVFVAIVYLHTAGWRASVHPLTPAALTVLTLCN